MAKILARIKWLFGIVMLFTKYDKGSLFVKVGEFYQELMFHDIIALFGDGCYTTYVMKNGDMILRCEGIGICCKGLPKNHFGRYCKHCAMNYHFYTSHSKDYLCHVLLHNGITFDVARGEKKRFLKDINRFKVSFGLKPLRKTKV